MKIKLFLVGILLTLILAPATVLAGAEVETLLFEEEEPKIFITTARLNLRSSPCTSQTRLALAPAGSRVEVLNFGCGEWYEVNFNGTWGFMYAEHLRELPQQITPGEVELLEWREARQLLTIGTPATLIDVRTGLSWQVASFSNGSHADIETLTAEDTAIKLQAFGGRWDWTPRPVLVVINGRTLAASVNGMPHAGSTRRGNNMSGHVCLHFLGSSTHNRTSSHERDHQNAVMEAFNTASAWQTSTFV